MSLLKKAPLPLPEPLPFPAKTLTGGDAEGGSGEKREAVIPEGFTAFFVFWEPLVEAWKMPGTGRHHIESARIGACGKTSGAPASSPRSLSLSLSLSL